LLDESSDQLQPASEMPDAMRGLLSRLSTPLVDEHFAGARYASIMLPDLLTNHATDAEAMKLFLSQLDKSQNKQSLAPADKKPDGEKKPERKK
jgi:hypothetical protein